MIEFEDTIHRLFFSLIPLSHLHSFSFTHSLMQTVYPIGGNCIMTQLFRVLTIKSKNLALCASYLRAIHNSIDHPVTANGVFRHPVKRDCIFFSLQTICYCNLQTNLTCPKNYHLRWPLLPPDFRFFNCRLVE